MIRSLRPAQIALQSYSHLAWPGLAAVLVLLLAAEWLTPAPGAGPRETLAVPAAAAAGADGAIGQWAEITLARPLFSPSRRPDDTSAGADGGLPRLSAIIMTGTSGIAIFSADGQKPQTLGVGGEIGGYQLQNISPDSVALLGPSGALTLHPQFAPAQPASTPGAASTVAVPTAAASTQPPPGQAVTSLDPGTAPGIGTPFGPLPRATPSSNPALYLEQNF